MKVKKTERQSERDSNWSEKREFSRPDAEVSQTQAEIETNMLQLADHKEAIDPRIQQQHFVKHGEMRRPCRLEPAQVNSNAEYREDKKITPFSPLIRVREIRAIKQQTDHDRQQKIKRKPTPAKLTIRTGNNRVWNAEQRRSQHPKSEGKPLCRLNAALPERREEKRQKREQRCKNDRHMEGKIQHQI